MNTDIVPVEQARVPQLYARMQVAIADCRAVDDCKQIADQAAAIAAYYKQIKDDTSVRQFIQIKLRAWRRIGQIVNQIDNSGCDTQAAHCRKIRDLIDDEALQQMSDASIYQAIRLANVPEDFFEDNVDRFRNVDALINIYKDAQHEAWLATPEGRAHLAEQKKSQAEHARWLEKRREIEAAESEERRKEKEEEEKELSALVAARDEAFGEVGVTMDRRDREEMKQVVLLLKKPVHEVLRKAAFEKRITMQAILRAGLRMWFAAHDYDISI